MRTMSMLHANHDKQLFDAWAFRAHSASYDEHAGKVSRVNSRESQRSTVRASRASPTAVVRKLISAPRAQRPDAAHCYVTRGLAGKPGSENTMKHQFAYVTSTALVFALAFGGLEPRALADETAPTPGTGSVAAPIGPSDSKLPVYGEVGIGFGQTLLFGDTKAALRRSYGGASDPGTGSSLMMGFVLAPRSFHGVGIGARIKGTFGSPQKGDQGDDYIFNGYALSLAVKAYPFAKTFNEGPYARVSIGFGQMTTKRQNEATSSYRHQYAIGLTLAGALGYTLPVGPVGLGLEFEMEYSNRNGTAAGIGATTFASGHAGGNFVVSF